MFRAKPKLLASTPFSDFIRNASAREKMRVYKLGLERATERQNQLLARVAKTRGTSE